tara:strand:- start:267 stop:458 length:192 start_codon:yes stop_codon:yes gene_type:complete
MIHSNNAPDALVCRADHVAAHRGCLRAAQNRMIMAGPYFSAGRDTRTGSIFVVDFADAATAEA